MKKFKVEFREVRPFVFDVLAKDEKSARTLAKNKLDKAIDHGTLHYHESGDPKMEDGLIYDVSHTDDPFDP